MQRHEIFARLLIVTATLTSGAKQTRADDAKKGGSRDEEVKKELAPKHVTLTADKIHLREALKRLKEQTGIEVEDRRRAEDAVDPVLKLDVKNATFWQALDAIAKEADARVGLYVRNGSIALVD